MRIFNWAEAFKETPTCDDILKRVRKVEIQYWIYLVISVLIAIAGINMMMEASDSDLKEVAMGLFLAIAGIIQIALIKLWAHIKLTTYFIIWDRNNTIEAEIKKSELQDM
jgi:predicted membrane channel-forming protein YqfA (hemolysin III family)